MLRRKKSVVPEAILIATIVKIPDVFEKKQMKVINRDQGQLESIPGHLGPHFEPLRVHRAAKPEDDVLSKFGQECKNESD